MSAGAPVAAARKTDTECMSDIVKLFFVGRSQHGEEAVGAVQQSDAVVTTGGALS